MTLIVEIFIYTFLVGFVNALLIKTFDKWGFFTWYQTKCFLSQYLKHCDLCWVFRIALIICVPFYFKDYHFIALPFTSWAITYFITQHT